MKKLLKDLITPTLACGWMIVCFAFLAKEMLDKQINALFIPLALIIIFACTWLAIVKDTIKFHKAIKA